ncbi:conserved hypothetical protein [Acinetobacter proteolyticus]|uniref:ABC transporter domain-containing protein n=1 Tax=Acinetobacter proteolyticus TaxID=1776741 RepID=A0A653K5L9_9GAMM|nr:hypothetical protein NG55_12600 [Acinetobacter gyllenbergii]VXA56053.1 conserved hypothetical protein [Acinetobacter proteolyticus]
MALLAYKNQFSGRVSSHIDKYVEVKMLSLHGERLADIVLTDQEKTDSYLFASESSELQKTEIDVKSLRFRYSEDESWIIHGINFNIPEGQSVAIVGPTGCGKITLMNLLLGNLTPEYGEIKIGGHEHVILLV